MRAAATVLLTIAAGSGTNKKSNMKMQTKRPVSSWILMFHVGSPMDDSEKGKKQEKKKGRRR